VPGAVIAVIFAAARLGRDDNGVASREERHQRLDGCQDDSLRGRVQGAAFRIRGRQPGSALAASNSAVGPRGELDHGRLSGSGFLTSHIHYARYFDDCKPKIELCARNSKINYDPFQACNAWK